MATKIIFMNEMNKDLVKKIQKLKEKKNALILVHNYQNPEIQEIADFLGDSLELAKKAAKNDADILIFCGVMFMAETAKILSPDKTVLIPRKDAGCPMADMIDVDQLLELKSKHPNAAVVTYVNSNAEVKAESDVCCTSANAIKVVQNIDFDQILFVPDKNLGAFCQRFTSKDIILWPGYCYVHDKITAKDVLQSKAKLPNAKIVVHPECRGEVIDLADEALSTSQMLDYAKKSDAKEFIIGTEEGMIYKLKQENPDKKFYSAGSVKTCFNMKKIELIDVYDSLLNNNYELRLDKDIISKSKTALEAMLRYI